MRRRRCAAAYRRIACGACHSRDARHGAPAPALYCMRLLPQPTQALARLLRGSGHVRFSCEARSPTGLVGGICGGRECAVCAAPWLRVARGVVAHALGPRRLLVQGAQWPSCPQALGKIVLGSAVT